jgi:hypothetical protein
VAEHVGMYVVDPYQYIALFALYLVIIYSLAGYSAELDKDAENKTATTEYFPLQFVPKSARGAGTQTGLFGGLTTCSVLVWVDGRTPMTAGPFS